MATQSIILYAAPIWEPAMKFAVHRRRVLKAQRVLALRVCSAYKTISTDAALVLAGLTPIHLLALERREIQNTKNSELISTAKKETLTKWQREWNISTKGRWTYQLIPNLDKWINRQHGRLSYRLTQFLSGDGVFMDFLVEIGKRQHARCMYCCETDNAMHTIFYCKHWEKYREKVVKKIGDINANNLVQKMLDKEENWKVVANFAEIVMKKKEEEENLEK